jgi:hypothetical protein
MAKIIKEIGNSNAANLAPDGEKRQNSKMISTKLEPSHGW